MALTGVISQLRTTNLVESVEFYTAKLGMKLDFQYEDFYAGIRAGNQVFHLKLVDDVDPGIEYVERGDHLHLYFETDDAADMAAKCKTNGIGIVHQLHETPWGTLEFTIRDNQGHTLYFGQSQ